MSDSVSSGLTVKNTNQTTRLNPSLVSTVEAMGAKSCIPDGFGMFWYPQQAVAGQAAKISLLNSQLGVTAPLWSTSTDALFGNVTVGNLSLNGSAIFPDSGTPLPSSWWDLQMGAAYIKQINERWSCGVLLGGGSVSDKPFADIHDDTISISTFVEWKTSPKTGWLFYVISTTHGQVGQNIPIPGVAYEFETPSCKGLIGFPFLDVTYNLTEKLNVEVYYAALTDVQARMNYRPVNGVTIFQGFTWSYLAWLRHGRADPQSMLFLYQKSLDCGVEWLCTQNLSLNLTGGFAFDRYFVENNGLSLHAKNEIHLGSTPFVGLQLLFQY